MIKRLFKAKGGLIAIFFVCLICGGILAILCRYVHGVYSVSQFNGPFNKNSLYFRVKNTTDFGTINLEFMPSFFNKNVTFSGLYRDIEEQTPVIQCIYAFPNHKIVDGSNFTETMYSSDLDKKMGIVLVGKSTYIEDTVTIGDFNCKVTGVFEAEKHSLNQYVYLIRENLAYVSPRGTFVISGGSTGENKKMFGFITKELKEMNIETIEVSKESGALSYLFSYEGDVILLYSLMIILLLFANVISVIFWIRTQIPFLKVCRFLGIKTGKFEVSKHYCALLLSGNYLGYFLVTAWEKSWAAGLELLPITTVVLIFFLVISLFSAFRYLRSNDFKG